MPAGTFTPVEPTENYEIIEAHELIKALENVALSDWQLVFYDQQSETVTYYDIDNEAEEVTELSGTVAVSTTVNVAGVDLAVEHTWDWYGDAGQDKTAYQYRTKARINENTITWRAVDGRDVRILHWNPATQSYDPSGVASTIFDATVQHDPQLILLAQANESRTWRIGNHHGADLVFDGWHVAGTTESSPPYPDRPEDAKVYTVDRQLWRTESGEMIAAMRWIDPQTGAVLPGSLQISSSDYRRPDSLFANLFGYGDGAKRLANAAGFPQVTRKG